MLLLIIAVKRKTVQKDVFIFNLNHLNNLVEES